MTQLYFYRVSNSPLVPVLAALLRRYVDSGLRTVVRGASLRRMEQVDKDLWSIPGDGFLPHGMAGCDYEAEHPVLLTVEKSSNQDADGLVAIDGAQVEPGEADDFKRISFVFEEHVSSDLNSARKHWKQFSDAGHPMQYWDYENGRWKKVAEANVPAS